MNPNFFSSITNDPKGILGFDLLFSIVSENKNTSCGPNSNIFSKLIGMVS